MGEALVAVLHVLFAGFIAVAVLHVLFAGFMACEARKEYLKRRAKTARMQVQANQVRAHRAELGQ